jgi:predicted nucleotidyltransferase
MDLIKIVGSRARAEIFKLLFEQAGSEYYLRELERRSGLTVGSIQQELSNLLSVGLVKSRKDGNRLYYSANSEHPLFPEILRMVEKTAGVPEVLKKALTDPEIRYAFVFGSVASGKAKAESDLDLFVAGDLGLRRLTKLLSGLSERIGRVINPHVMSVQELNRKALEKDHFISSLMGSQKIFLIGDENEFKRLGKKRLAESP